MHSFKTAWLNSIKQCNLANMYILKDSLSNSEMWYHYTFCMYADRCFYNFKFNK